MYEQNISRFHTQPGQRRLSEQEDDSLEPGLADEWLSREAGSRRIPTSAGSMRIPRSLEEPLAASGRDRPFLDTESDPCLEIRALFEEEEIIKPRAEWFQMWRIRFNESL